MIEQGSIKESVARVWGAVDCLGMGLGHSEGVKDMCSQFGTYET